ncbi:MAG: putative sulfate exporter family transporter [Phycisphaerales bacterium]
MKNETKLYLLWLSVSVTLAVIFESPAVALIIGAVIALTGGNPARKQTSKASKYMLQTAVILLGFKLQIDVVLKVGLSSIWITMISIVFTMLLGWLLGKMFKTDVHLTTLLSSGTAICGGSAIAAMAPAIGASPTITAISLAVVFLLNAVGLLIFPEIGAFFHLTQSQFGIWSALAIHDTSSVVGAASIYGTTALSIATTVKLTRALWILPLSFAGSYIHKSKSAAKFPWFLLGFLATSAINTYVTCHPFSVVFSGSAFFGKRLMVATLFLIGLGLTRSELKNIGIKPLIQAIILWLIVASITLTFIIYGILNINV